MLLLLVITGKKTCNMPYVAPILSMFSFFFFFATDSVCFLERNVLHITSAKCGRKHTSISAWRNHIKAVKNGMRARTSH